MQTVKHVLDVNHPSLIESIINLDESIVNEEKGCIAI